MGLKCNDARGGGFVLLVVDHFGHQNAIDIVLEVVALGNNSIVVPIFILHFGLQLDGVGEFFDFLFAVAADCDLLATLGQKGAGFFFVVHAGVFRAGVDIGLIAANDELGFV